MSTYKVIDRSDVVDPRRGAHLASERHQALINGETIFVPGSGSWRSNAWTFVNKRGFRLVTRAHTIDGIPGFAAWTEPR